jgi:hypothetical protein
MNLRCPRTAGLGQVSRVRVPIRRTLPARIALKCPPLVAATRRSYSAGSRVSSPGLLRSGIKKTQASELWPPR